MQIFPTSYSAQELAIIAGLKNKVIIIITHFNVGLTLEAYLIRFLHGVVICQASQHQQQQQQQQIAAVVFWQTSFKSETSNRLVQPHKLPD